MLKSLRNIFKNLGGGFLYAFLLILRTPVDTLLCIINALFFKGVFEALEQGMPEALARCCICFVAANGFVFLYNGILWGEFAVFSARMIGKLRLKFLDALQGLPLGRIEAMTDGAWITRGNADVKMTWDLLSGALNIPHFVFAIFRIAVASVIMYCISPLFLVIELAVIVPHVFLRHRYVVKPAEQLIQKAQKETEQTAVVASSLLAGGDTVRIFEAEGMLEDYYTESSLNIVRTRLKIAVRKAWGEFMQLLLGRGGYLLLFLLGCEMVRGGGMNFGSLTAVLQYRGAMVAASMMLMNSLVEIKKNSVGMKRMEEVFDDKQ